MTPSVVVHLGLRESAPVRLQQALERLRPQLHGRGVGVVTPAGPKSPRDWAATRPARASRGDARRVDGDAADALGLAAKVQREAARLAGGGRAATMLVCPDRVLEGHHVTGAGPACGQDLDLAAIPEALAASGAASARVVLYIRRQDRLMELAHLRAVRLGWAHEVAPLARGVEAPLSYEALVGWLERLSYVDDVVVRPYELVAASAARHVADFLGSAGLDGELDWTAVGTDLAADPVYSAQACRIAVDTAAFLESKRERRLLDEFLITHFAAADERNTRLVPDRQRARILEAHAPANRALFERRVPDVPADAYTSEEATQALAGTGPPGDEPPEGPATAASTAVLGGPGARRLRRWARAAAPIAGLWRSGDGEPRRVRIGRPRRRPGGDETRRSLSP